MTDGRDTRMRARPGHPRTRRCTAGLASVAAVTAFLATAGAARAVQAMTPVGLAGIVPAGASRIGTIPAATTLHIDVVLNPADGSGLTRYATDVATPGSPLYHHYLAKGRFAGLFGASGAAIANVLAGLRALGLRPGAVASDHLSIPVTATAAQVESAFGITLASYLLNGRAGYSNTSAPRLPAAVAAHVEDIIGLDSLPAQHALMARPSPAPHALSWRGTVRPAHEPTGGPQPCASASSEANSTGAFTADQLAYGYEFSALYHAGDFGRGVSVGIVEFGEPDRPADIATYQKCYHTHVTVSYHKVDKFSRRGPGQGEAALDIETVAGLAPDAKIEVYQAPNNGTAPYDAYRAIVDQDRVRVVSESYGLCERYQDRSALKAVNYLYAQAAVQGQTIVASSGDTGSEACLPNDGNLSRLNVNFPASDPLVLGVGGTTLTKLQSRPGEAVWNERAYREGASGGGKSSIFAEPSYQKSFGIKARIREVPDVSADADPSTGYVVYYNRRWLPIGGTSAAAPLWASLLALTDEKCSSSPVGWVNPAIYYAASPHVKAIVLDDISRVSGWLNNNDYTGRGHGHYAVGHGYDMATGLGSPIAGPLATALCKLSSEPAGYWLATANGRIYAFNAPFRGSLARKHLASRVVAIAADPKTNGYWLVTKKGAVSAFDAPWHGSVKHATQIVGIASDASGSGYWVVSATGQVYAFHAPARGSVRHPSSPVVGIASDRQANGYWIVTANGRVYAFHARRFRGKKLTDVTGIAADPHRQGYWLVTSRGRVYGFGISADGSMRVNLGKVVGIAGDDSRPAGYWLATLSGHVAAFSSSWHGDHPASGSPVVGIAGSS